MGFKDHLLSRNYDPSLYVNQTIDEEGELLTVHLFNLEGKFVGYQRYDPSGSKKTNVINEAKYMTYTMKGEKAFWGLETLDYTQDTLFVVEGLFKASALHKAGYNAICVFGNRAEHLKDLLLSFNMNIIAICDNDDAGMKLGLDVENMGGVSLLFDEDVDEYDTSVLKSILINLGIFGG